jgi:hypothetical protein
LKTTYFLVTNFKIYKFGYFIRFESSFKEKNDNSLNLKVNKNEQKRSSNFITYKPSNNSSAFTNAYRYIEDEINDSRIINDDNFEFKDTLSFWKSNEIRFKDLSKLAKKYLGVQASSAGVERIFSISGHIFQSKRRKMGIDLFSTMVFLKLNEKLLID